MNNSTKEASMYEDGLILEQVAVNFNNENQAGAIGEINTQASQIPGGYSSNSTHEIFSNIQVWSDVQGSLYGGKIMTPTGTSFEGNYYNGSNWDAIWDTACPS